MVNRKEREPIFDTIKGILIFLVVFGHCIPEEWQLHRYIYSFHIPAFFIVEGFVLRYTSFNEKNFISVLVKCVKTLFIPYIFFSSILLLLRWWDSGFSGEVIRFQIMDMILLCGVGAMWFLPCLCIAKIIFRIIITKKLFSFVAGILFVIPMFLDDKTSIHLVLFRSFIALGFIYIGYFLLPTYCLLKKYKAYIIVFIFCIFVSLLVGVNTIITNAYALNTLDLKPVTGYLMASISGTGMVFLLSMLLQKYVKKFSNILGYLGQCSLYIMGLHQSVMILIPRTGLQFVDKVLNTVISIMLSVLGAYFIKYFQNRRLYR